MQTEFTPHLDVCASHRHRPARRPDHLPCPGLGSSPEPGVPHMPLFDDTARFLAWVGRVARAGLPIHRTVADPVELRTLLPKLLIARADTTGEHRAHLVTLVGEHIQSWFSDRLKGRFLDGVGGPRWADHWRSVFHAAAAGTVPCGHARVMWRGQPHAVLEWAVVPMSSGAESAVADQFLVWKRFGLASTIGPARLDDTLDLRDLAVDDRP